MPDRLFFLVCSLVAAVMVVLALEPFSERAPSGPVSAGGRNAEDITVRHAELHRFVAGGSSGLTIEAQGNGGEKIARIMRLPSEIYEDPRRGPHLILAEDLEFAFEARPVEITIEARSEGEFAAAQFQANYLARPGDESGWITFDLTDQFTSHTFTYSPPPRGPTQGYDYLGIRPAAAQRRATIEIRAVRLRAAGPKVRPEVDASIP